MKSSMKKPSRRQLAVIDDLFDGKMDEAEILEKHNLRISVFRKWLASDSFIAELDQRAAATRRQSEMIIARFAPAAAAELVALTECEKAETRRKACLDIITAATSVAATLCNIGPGLEKVGSIENYAFIPPAGKFFLSVCMILGRLELVTVLAILLPNFWRR